MPPKISDKDDIIQIVLAVYDPGGKYCRHVGVLLTSIFERTKSPARVTILHDETLNDDNRARLLRTAGSFGQEVRFADVSEAISQMGGDIDKIAGGFSRGTLFRLFIPELINASKIIYLDCDIVVNLDIVELWGIDISGYALGAAPDGVIIRRNRQRLRGRARTWAMKYDGERYFNAGVLLMNLDVIRQSLNISLVDAAKNFFRRYRICLDYPDQDLLNALFCGRTLMIDGRFNRIGDRRDVENAILHLTGGGSRPWVPHVWEPGDYLYWDIFARSEWRDLAVPTMLDMYASSKYIHRGVSDCAGLLLKRLAGEIAASGLAKLPRDVVAVSVELYHRFKERNYGR